MRSVPQRVLAVRVLCEMIGPSSAAGEKWRTIGSKWAVEEGIDEKAFPGIWDESAGQL